MSKGIVRRLQRQPCFRHVRPCSFAFLLSPCWLKATVILTHFVDFCTCISDVDKLGSRAVIQGRLVRIWLDMVVQKENKPWWPLALESVSLSGTNISSSTCFLTTGSFPVVVRVMGGIVCRLSRVSSKCNANNVMAGESHICGGQSGIPKFLVISSRRARHNPSSEYKSIESQHKYDLSIISSEQTIKQWLINAHMYNICDL